MTDSSRPDIDFPSRIGVWWASETWADARRPGGGPGDRGPRLRFAFHPRGHRQGVPDAVGGVPRGHRAAGGRHRHRQHPRPDPVGRRDGRPHADRAVPAAASCSGSASVTPRSSKHGIGGTYAKPLATMRAYLEKMAAVPEAIEPGAGRPVRLLAALGPKMIELSGTHADGAHPYLVLPEQTRVTRDILGPGQVDRVRAGRHRRRLTPTSSCSGRTATSTSTAGCRTTGTRGCGRASTSPTWCAAAPTGWPGRWSGWARSTQAAASRARAPRRGRRPRRAAGARRRPDGRSAARAARAGRGAGTRSRPRL